ncbi:pyruvate kinase [Dongia rigui]|uniref:Pyruvate kinase n=1 Tax=Dongia rigui TaxID=940149 RepID=A0ABU5DUR2_9PROT|nr:pyruvate kinase [Dongia rigui]MDY0871050.1 pyruvate kinase [Dongia rigui]
MRRQRKAKIVATLGPATSTQAEIEGLFLAGVDVFRLNFSHGSHADHKKRYDIIRYIEQSTKRPIGVLVDLQGPKLRVGQFENGSVTLEPGQKFRFDLDPALGNEHRAPLPHPEILSALRPGVTLLLDDGKLRMRVRKAAKDAAECEVEIGGTLSDRKGVNVPDVVLPLSPLTKKDRTDLTFALDLGADWIALSFVQRPEDVAEARKLIQGRARIISKLEKPAAIERLDEIVELSDAVMVARGDLGVEMPAEDVPGLQKRIIAACRLAGKPVVVATQMLDSMVNAPTPTRAEASDVATAVYDGADAVMLSAETASGRFPLESVSMMNRIAERVERDPFYRRILEAQRLDHEATASDAISQAAAQVAHTLSAAAICTYTTSGSTGLRMARERPDAPILCLTSKLQTARNMALVWGTHCVVTADIKRFSEMAEKACRIALREDFAKAGERIVVTAGVPLGTPGSTNILRVAWVEE